MPEKRSVYTQVALDLGKRLAKLDTQALKSTAIPFGMERVTAEAEAKRLMEMGSEGKKAYLEQHGVQKTLAVLRRGVGSA